MTEKRWTIILIAVTFFSLLIFAGVMLLLDPVLNYGAEGKITSYYHYSTLYTNPGIAKHYEYDAVMVGTSMIQNTNVDKCDELWNCNMVRLPYSGGTSYDMKSILEVWFETGYDIKTVYWELDQFQLTSSATEHRYPVPEYLYNYTWTDDLSYLLNLDVMYHYGLNNVLSSLRGQTSAAERRGITFGGDYNKNAVLSGYTRPEQTDTTSTFEGTAMQKDTGANLENILSLVTQHPDTEFVFFMPPFSMLYWDKEVRNGTFEATMDATEYALEQLVDYENVTVYYYQGEQEIISDLDNYKDFSHYGNWINDLLTQYIAEGRNHVTKENCAAYIQELKDYVYAFDFEAVFS